MYVHVKSEHVLQKYKNYVICHEKLSLFLHLFLFFRQKLHTNLFDVSAALHSACTQLEQRPHLNHNSSSLPIPGKTCKFNLSR
jgi:hypothetical protein